MTTEQLSDLWAKCENEHWCFTELPELRFNKRRDINAFLLLDSILPGTTDMVSCAEHDEIWLCIDVKKLAEVITPEQVMELVRCGVYYDDNIDSLHMMR